MQVTFTREWSGHPAGETADVDGSLGRSLVKHGYATPAGTVQADSSATADLNLDNDPPAQTITDSPDTGDNTEGV